MLVNVLLPVAARIDAVETGVQTAAVASALLAYAVGSLDKKTTTGVAVERKSLVSPFLRSSTYFQLC